MENIKVKYKHLKIIIKYSAWEKVLSWIPSLT